MFCSVFAPLVAPHDPLEFEQDIRRPRGALSGPTASADTLSRVIYGSRVTLLMGMLAVALAGAAGLLAGVTAGYHGGLLDNMIMRVMESIAVIPFLLIAVLAAASKGFTATGSAIAIGVTLMPDFASWSRALVLNIHGSGFLEAERAFRHTQSRNSFPPRSAEYLCSVHSEIHDSFCRSDTGFYCAGVHRYRRTAAQARVGRSALKRVCEHHVRQMVAVCLSRADDPHNRCLRKHSGQ